MKMIMLSLVVEKIDLSKTKCAKFSPQLVLSLVIGIPLLFGLSAVLGFWKGQRLRGLISFTRRAFFQGSWSCRTDNHFRIILNVARWLFYGIDHKRIEFCNLTEYRN